MWTVGRCAAYMAASTVSAPAGSRVAQEPRRSLSLWNDYQLRPRVALGLGLISRTAVFAAIDDPVVLPGYLRVDGAIFYSRRRGCSLPSITAVFAVQPGGCEGH